jgi:gas vesicle protein
VVGAAAGLLLAPKSGAETRAIIREKTQEYLDSADGLYETGRDKAVELYSTASGKAGDAGDALKEKIDAARAKLGETVTAAGDKTQAGLQQAKAAVAEAKAAVSDKVSALKGDGGTPVAEDAPADDAAAAADDDAAAPAA